jgi:hypothetical protein
VKAISLWQPWASLWVAGRKANETRHWPTDYRGPLLVHAAKKICVDVAAELAAILEDEFGGHWARDLPRGAIVGAVELVSCRPTEQCHVDAEEWACGNYGPGRFAWGVQNAYVFCEPIPYRGAQGFFNVVDDRVTAALCGGSIAAPPPPQGRLL